MVRLVLVLFFVFFFKQKTAYEMRISDWSSDVCSSDLDVGALLLRHEIDGKSGDRQRLSALLCMNLLAVDMAASAQNRMAQAARQRVQYPSGQDRPHIGQRDDDAEGRLACREIAGAIDGIDDPVQPFARPVQYGGVGGGQERKRQRMNSSP